MLNVMLIQRYLQEANKTAALRSLKLIYHFDDK